MKATFKLTSGTLIDVGEDRFIVVELVDLENALCRRLANSETKVIPIKEIQLARDQKLIRDKKKSAIDLVTIPQEEWNLASMRLEAIRKLHDLGRNHRTHELIDATCKTLGKSRQTIYRWLKKYEVDGTITPFLRDNRSDKMQSRLDPEVDKIIMDSIKRILLKLEYGTIREVYYDVKECCLKKGLKPPGESSIRARFLAISEEERVRSRQGKKAAKERFTPLLGSFPGANHPLDVIQIDHTPYDIMLVDEVYRKPIGRPIITLAIDVYSRMVVGFNLWLESASAASVGLCLLHAMLPKDEWLAKRDINASWPCFGKPRKIHTDNAKEFRGNVLGRICQSYGIDLEQRPKGSPQYGGTVERGFWTYMRKSHTVSGTTFSNPQKKLDYDSSNNAIFTLGELERWFTLFLLKVYHARKHEGITCPPILKYTEGILGSEDKVGIGIPERFSDPERLRLDLLPYVERTIQEYGVVLDGIKYYDDALRPYIHAKDPTNPKSARRFIFRRDPLDISVLYFWDPDLLTYRNIPYANLGRPPMTLWEVRAVRRELLDKGNAAVDENLIFEGLAEMRQIEQGAAEKTKVARRNEQRRREAEKRKNVVAKAKNQNKSDEAAPVKDVHQNQPKTVAIPDDEFIAPFDDLDMR